MTETLHFNRFEEIKHTPLRVFNRVAYYYNLYEDKGRETAKQYIETFSDWERKQMGYIMIAIKTKAEDGHPDPVGAIRQTVTKDAEFKYDPNEDY